MTTLFKRIFFFVIINLLTLPLYSSDTIEYEVIDTVLIDTTHNDASEIEMYLYHMNGLLEYQAFEIDRQRSIIYKLIGVISILVTILVLRWFSNRYEKSFGLHKVKKHEQVPAATLKMIFRHYKIKARFKELQTKMCGEEECEITLTDLVETAGTYGLECFVLKGGMGEMTSFLKVPVISIFQNHLSVVYKVKKENMYLSDAYYGYVKQNPFYFANNWYSDKTKEVGVYVVLLPVQNRTKDQLKVAERINEVEKLEKRYWKNYRLH